MLNIRHFTVRNASFFERCYVLLEAALLRLHSLFKLVGYQKLDKPVAAVEKVVKGFLFGSQNCGLCTLSSSGMACPMNCPKTLRNGPCGGVRANGNCEVKPEMRCVWVEAFEGSRRMRSGDKIRIIQKPVDHRLKGTSSWLREVRLKKGYIGKNTELL